MSKIMEVIDIVDQPDGSAIMNMDVEPEQASAFAHAGLRYLIEQMGIHDDMYELAPNTFELETRTMELTNEEFNALFQFGVISALKRGIDESNKETVHDE